MKASYSFFNKFTTSPSLRLLGAYSFFHILFNHHRKHSFSPVSHRLIHYLVCPCCLSILKFGYCTHYFTCSLVNSLFNLLNRVLPVLMHLRSPLPTQAAEKMFFDATSRIIQLRPSRQRGGVSDTVPSPRRYTNSYIKWNTGDGREPSTPLL